MKIVLIVLALGLALLATKRLLAGEIIAPAEAAKRVAEGGAVLIDVREPAEWESGVVENALLLPLSDLRGERLHWKAMLERHRDRELVLYCRSGNRSGIAASILSAEGFRVVNAGGFPDWQAAGQPTRKP
jgi:rhodanese-related sulfurtransferase